MTTYPFVGGGIYANRKGSYEVLEIDGARGQMLIRYLETGETLRTPIADQARIWENMDLEEQETVRQRAAEDARFQKGYGEGFRGLQASDFKLSTENTTWRSRQALPGRVCKLLSQNTPYTFVSWAIYGWPVTFLTHRDDYQMAAFEQGSRKAKFTIELDESHVHYGFYIERNQGPMDSTWDWPRLLQSLHSNAVLREVIERAEAEQGARFIGRMSTGEEHFHFSNGLQMGARSLWEEGRPTEIPILHRLSQIEAIPPDHWGELYMVGSLPKQEALRLGPKVAEPIAQLMRSLLPLYAAAVGHAGSALE